MLSMCTRIIFATPCNLLNFATAWTHTFFNFSCIAAISEENVFFYCALKPQQVSHNYDKILSKTCFHNLTLHFFKLMSSLQELPRPFIIPPSFFPPQCASNFIKLLIKLVWSPSFVIPASCPHSSSWDKRAFILRGVFCWSYVKGCSPGPTEGQHILFTKNKRGDDVMSCLD